MQKRIIDYSLYLVTDRALSLGRPLIDVIRPAVDGGVTVVQLREKEIDSREFYREALRIRDAAYLIELAARTGDLAHVAEYMADVRREFARFEQTVANPQGPGE